MDRWNNELEALFRDYKAAAPDPEASADFMPELWRRIEAKQSLMLRIRKLSQIFVGAAAAISLLFAMIEIGPGSPRPEIHGTYVDALSAARPADSLASLGIVARESADARTK